MTLTDGECDRCGEEGDLVTGPDGRRCLECRREEARDDDRRDGGEG